MIILRLHKQVFFNLTIQIDDLSIDALDTNQYLQEIKELNIQNQEVGDKNRVEESEYFEMVSNLRIGSITKIVMIILGVMQVLNIALFLTRDPVQTLVFKDIQYHIMTVDLENWISFSQIHPALFVDVSRAAREGWIENDSFLPYENATATKYSMAQWYRSTTFPWACERLLLRNHSNITMGYLYPRDKWINDFIDVDFYYDRTFESYDDSVPLSDRLNASANAGLFTITKDVKWRKENLHRSQGIQLMEFMGEYLRNRNYSTLDGTWEQNDMDIPYLRPEGYEQAQETHPTPPDRNRDPAEDFFRRLVTGLTSNSTYHRSVEFLDFYKACGNFYEKFILWSGVSMVCTTLFGWLIVSIILLWQMTKMRRFWSDILSVQVSINYSFKIIVLKIR